MTAFVQLFEYFTASYLITSKMNGKWENDKKLISHKLNSLETKLEIIIVWQEMNLKIHCSHYFESNLVFCCENNKKTHV